MKAGKERILDAAMAVIARVGIEACSMRGIAKEAGVSTGAIYYYFTSREEVMYQVMEKNLKDARRLADKAVEHNLPKQEVLQDVVNSLRKHFQEIDTNMIHFTLLAEACLKNSDQKEVFQAQYQQWSDDITALMKYVYGCKDDETARTLGQIILASIEGMTVRLILEGKKHAPEALIKVYEHMLEYVLPESLKALQAE
jgi:AcrR family transcriptional regulator